MSASSQATDYDFCLYSRLELPSRGSRNVGCVFEKSSEPRFLDQRYIKNPGFSFHKNPSSSFQPGSRFQDGLLLNVAFIPQFSKNGNDGYLSTFLVKAKIVALETDFQRSVDFKENVLFPIEHSKGICSTKEASHSYGRDQEEFLFFKGNWCDKFEFAKLLKDDKVVNVCSQHTIHQSDFARDSASHPFAIDIQTYKGIYIVGPNNSKDNSCDLDLEAECSSSATSMMKCIMELKVDDTEICPLVYPNEVALIYKRYHPQMDG